MPTRAFIALTLDDEIVATLAACADELRAVDRGGEIRWVVPHNYHLTLEFLGDLEHQALAALGARLEQEFAADGLGAQTIREVSYFPFVARPRVVAALASASDALLSVHARAVKAVRGCGITLQRRRFHPHITLGRVRARRSPRLRIPPVTLDVDTRFCSITLFESRLSAQGASYTPLFEVPLDSDAIAGPGALTGR